MAKDENYDEGAEIFSHEQILIIIFMGPVCVFSLDQWIKPLLQIHWIRQWYLTFDPQPDHIYFLPCFSVSLKEMPKYWRLEPLGCGFPLILTSSYKHYVWPSYGNQGNSLHSEEKWAVLLALCSEWVTSLGLGSTNSGNHLFCFWSQFSKVTTRWR